MAVTSKSKIEFIIGLDENKIPEELNWSADDGNIKNSEVKAMLVSVWDHSTFETATNDEKMTATMRDFCDYFAEKLELKK